MRRKDCCKAAYDLFCFFLCHTPSQSCNRASKCKEVNQSRMSNYSRRESSPLLSNVISITKLCSEDAVVMITTLWNESGPQLVYTACSKYWTSAQRSSFWECTYMLNFISGKPSNKGHLGPTVGSSRNKTDKFTDHCWHKIDWLSWAI